MMDKRGELLNLISQARGQGARGAEVTRIWRHTLEQSDPKARPQPVETSAWQVVVWLEDGRVGTGTAETREEALAAAFASPVPSVDAGPMERMDIRSAGTGLDDRRHSILSDSDRQEVLHLAEKALVSCPIKTQPCVYRQVREGRALANTRGIETEEYTTLFELETSAMVDGEGLHHRIASRHFSDIASLPFGTELKRRLEPLSRRLPSLPPLPIVMEPRVVADLFRQLAPAFAADSILSGRSFLKDYLGKAIASPIFHITDDAGLFGGLKSHSFDHRGVPPIPVTLLKEGVVMSLYHDANTARHQGLRPTGHSQDGRLVPSNLIVRPGSRTRNVVLTELGSYLLLDRIPNLDTSSGLLEGATDLVLVEKGEKRGSKSENISIPVTRLLRAIKEVVSDHERTCEVDAPTAVFFPGFGQ